MVINFGPLNEMTLGRFHGSMGGHIAVGKLGKLETWFSPRLTDFYENWYDHSLAPSTNEGDPYEEVTYLLWVTTDIPFGLNPFASLTPEHLMEIIGRRFGELTIPTPTR